jgi:hypothetical protein
MHDKYSNKRFQQDNLFHSIQLFRQRLNEINEVFIVLYIFINKQRYSRFANV